MWELEHKEGWALKNWCFQIVLKKTHESPLDFKEIRPVDPKGNLPQIVIRLTDTEAEVPLATWWEDPTHWDSPWSWERLRAKGEGQQTMRCLDGISGSMDMNMSKLWETVEDRAAWHAIQFMGSQRAKYNSAVEWMNSSRWIRQYEIWWWSHN